MQTTIKKLRSRKGWDRAVVYIKGAQPITIDSSATEAHWIVDDESLILIGLEVENPWQPQPEKVEPGKTMPPREYAKLESHWAIFEIVRVDFYNLKKPSAIVAP